MVFAAVACGGDTGTDPTPPPTPEAPPQLRIEALRNGSSVEPTRAVAGETLMLLLWVDGEQACWGDLDWFTPTLATAIIEPDDCSAWYTAPETISDRQTDTIEVQHPEYGNATLQIILRNAEDSAVYFVLDVSARMYWEFGPSDPRAKMEVATGLLESFHNNGVLQDQLTGLLTFGDLGIGGGCENAIRPRVGLRNQVANVNEVSSTLDEIRGSQPGVEQAPLNRAILKAINEIPSDIRKGGDFRIVIYTGGYNECPDDPHADRFVRALETAVGEGADIEAIIVGAGLDPEDEEGLEGLALLTRVLSGFMDVECVNFRPPTEEDDEGDLVEEGLAEEPCF
jgi:hypothetical protein